MGTLSDRLHAEDLRQVAIGEADRLRTQYPDQEPESSVTTLLTRVQNALESRPLASQEPPSSGEDGRPMLQHSSAAGYDEISLVHVQGAENTVSSAAQSAAPVSGVGVTSQDLIDVGGCAQSQANTTMTGGPLRHSQSRESVGSNGSSHAEITRTKLQYERQLFEARQKAKELEAAVEAEKMRHQREMESRLFTLRQTYETSIAEIRDEYEDRERTLQRQVATTNQSTHNIVPSTTVRSSHVQFATGTTSAKNNQPTFTASAITTHATRQTQTNTPGTVPPLSTQPFMQPFTQPFTQQLAPILNTRTTVSGDALSFGTVSNSLLYSTTSAYQRPIAHHAISGNVNQPLVQSSLYQQTGNTGTSMQCPASHAHDPPRAAPSLHSGRFMSDIAAPSEAASMSLLAIQTEAHAYSMLTQRRPKEKFTGDNSKIDFDSFLHQCQNLMKVPGATDAIKLAELPYWFGGTAQLVIDRYIGEADATAALADAFKALKQEFGRRNLTAKQLLVELLQGEKFSARDHMKTKTFILNLQKIYKIAEETGRSSSFNTPEVINDVIRLKLPHLASKLAKRVADKQVDHYDDDVTVSLTFNEFLTFLKRENSISRTMDDIMKPSEASQVLLKPTARVGASWSEPVRSRNTYTNPQNQVSPCVFCPGNVAHQSVDCRRFASYTNEKKAEVMREKRLCTRCLGTGHKASSCATKDGCGVCQQRHHTLLHDIPSQNLTLPPEGNGGGTA